MRTFAQHRAHMKKGSRSYHTARTAMSDWPDEETNEPLLSDHRNFYKIEKWTKDGTKVDCMVYAGSSLEKRGKSSLQRSSLVRAFG
jgi:hypothetical protein